MTTQNPKMIRKEEARSSTTWSRLKDPRIVRVSRAMGGKDRHSKVCTVRGLRDRRVRLSVPTAIQLYDLQERLGLNQPSKVVDWLLDAAKNEIDELPPLQIPQGICFSHPTTNNLLSRHTTQEDEEQTHEFHFQNPSSFASSTSYGRWDPSISLGLAAHHQHQDFVSHQHQHQHQLLVYQAAQPYFVPQINAAFDTKHHPSFHGSDLSTSSHVRPFDFNTTASQNSHADADDQNKRNLV